MTRYVHDPDCASITQPIRRNGHTAPCDCKKRQRSRQRVKTASPSGRIRAGIGGPQESIGNGNYHTRLVRSPGD